MHWLGGRCHATTTSCVPATVQIVSLCGVFCTKCTINESVCEYTQSSCQVNIWKVIRKSWSKCLLVFVIVCQTVCKTMKWQKLSLDQVLGRAPQRKWTVLSKGYASQLFNLKNPGMLSHCNVGHVWAKNVWVNEHSSLHFTTRLQPSTSFSYFIWHNHRRVAIDACSVLR